MSSSVTEQELEAVLDNLLDDYRDLQSIDATVLSKPPSAREAARLIHRAHPVLIQGFSPLTPQGEDRDWSKSDIYREIGGNRAVSVAITDDGLADSVRMLEDGSTTFVKPFEEKMSIPDLIDHLHQSTDRGEGSPSADAYYLQSQDGNVYRSTPHMAGAPELEMFQQYIQRDVEWMRDAVDTEAEAVNLWIGNSRSTTSLHHDPYENIYHVLAGTKIFTLLSPIEGLWLDQHFHPPSTLRRSTSGSLAPILDAAPSHPIPWISATTFPPRVHPIRIRVEEGQTLFLPAGWWHRVEQQEGDEGIVVAVNYWYPSDLNPERYAYERFASRIARLAGRHGVIPVPGDGPVPDNIWGNDSDTNSGSGDEWDPADWGR